MVKSKAKYVRRKPQVPVRKWGCKGRPIKHGGYSLAIRDQVLKENPRVTRYLVDTRAGLVKDVAGSEDALSEQQRVMIDRIISKLAICRLIELYVEKHGAFPQIKVRGKTIVKMELHACLGINYLAFSNAIDRALVALGLNKKQAETVLSPLEIAAEIDAEKEKRAKSTVAKARRDPGQETRTPAGEGEGKGEAEVQATKAKETATRGPGLAQDGGSAAGQDDGKGREAVDPGGNGQGGGKQASEIDGGGRSLDNEGQDMGAGQGEETSHGDE